MILGRKTETVMALMGFTLFAALPALAQSARQIGIGETLRGELAAGDATMEDGSYVDSYAFQTAAGQSYVVTLTSDEFDTYLRVNGPGGLSTENDDAQDGVTSSRLEFTAPAAGEVRIQANSLTRRETGHYSISLQPGVAQRRIAIAEQLSGDLTANSPKQRDGTPYQAFVFEGRAGQSVTVDMKSRDFDSYLVLRRAGSNEDLAVDDDGGGGQDAQILFALPASGTYEVRANSISSSARGRFTLKLTDGVTERKPQTTAIDYGRVVRGELKTGSGRDATGLFYDSYSFVGHAGDRVTLSATSSDFDPVLYLGKASRTREDDWLDSNDDETASETDSLIQVVLPVDTTYEIHVVSYNPGEAGHYVLGLGVTH
jgi:hypothetical protein